MDPIPSFCLRGGQCHANGDPLMLRRRNCLLLVQEWVFIGHEAPKFDQTRLHFRQVQACVEL